MSVSMSSSSPRAAPASSTFACSSVAVALALLYSSWTFSSAVSLVFFASLGKLQYQLPLPIFSTRIMFSSARACR
jgi:hypothetical protein